MHTMLLSSTYRMDRCLMGKCNSECTSHETKDLVDLHVERKGKDLKKRKRRRIEK